MLVKGLKCILLSLIIFSALTASNAYAKTTYTIKEFGTDKFELVGKKIKLKFFRAHRINAISADEYSILVSGKDSTMSIRFPKEGLKWFKMVSKKNKERKRILYGNVRMIITEHGNGTVTKEPMFVAFGRTSSKSAGKATTYHW